MHLVIDARGTVRAIYSEEIDLATLGRPAIVRASHVEPTPDGQSVGFDGLEPRAAAGVVTLGPG